METANQQLLPDQISRPTDFELLQACWVVTIIPDFHLTRPYPELEMVYGNLQTMRENPSAPFPIATPTPLVKLREFGWKLFFASHWDERISRKNDYQGIILINQTTKTILLTHRGMQFTNENLSEALLIATNKVPPITQDALNMCNIALDLIRDRFPDFRVIHTGFSMGGFLAQLTSAYCNNLEENSRHNLCVCFDPPGASDAIPQCGYLRSNRTNTFVYVTAPNAVNTATPHYGYVRQISKYADKNAYKGKLKPFFVDQPFEIDTRDCVPRVRLENAERYSALVELGKSTFKYHDQDILREDLSDQLYFKFNHVQNWPLSANRVRPPTSRKPYQPIHHSSLLLAGLDIAIDVGNAYLKSKSASILSRSELEGHHIIEHQIINPNVAFSHAPYLTDVSLQLPEPVLFAAGWIVALIQWAIQQKEQRELALLPRSDAQNLGHFGLNRSSQNSDSDFSGEEGPDSSLDRTNNYSSSL